MPQRVFAIGLWPYFGQNQSPWPTRRHSRRLQVFLPYRECSRFHRFDALTVLAQIRSPVLEFQPDAAVICWQWSLYQGQTPFRISPDGLRAPASLPPLASGSKKRWGQPSYDGTVWKEIGDEGLYATKAALNQESQRAQDAEAALEDRVVVLEETADELADIAFTGDVKDLVQTNDPTKDGYYLILDCNAE